MLELINPKNNEHLYLDKDGLFYFDKYYNEFPIINKIPRITNKKNYADNFGFQWNKFNLTQIDNYDTNNIFTLSYDRFFSQTNKTNSYFDNKNILEIGCGAGRFSKVVLNFTKANLYSVDISNAVEANLNNNKKFHNKNFFIFQSDLYNLPFSQHSFDFVYCFGVLQHTPDINLSLKKNNRASKT